MLIFIPFLYFNTFSGWSQDTNSSYLLTFPASDVLLFLCTYRRRVPYNFLLCRLCFSFFSVHSSFRSTVLRDYILPFPVDYFSFSVFREIAQVQEESGQMAIRLGRDNFFLTSLFPVFKPSVVDPNYKFRIRIRPRQSFGSGSRPYLTKLLK
jgi:hypothetical protein